MNQKRSFKRFLYENSLSIALFSLFFSFLIGLSITGWHEQNEELSTHNQPQQSYGEYLTGGEFSEAVFENWESEFLQMWALVMLTIILRQKGSADSKKLRGKAEVDTASRYSIIHAHSWRTGAKATGHFIRDHSLGFALLSIFLVSFILHALSGTSAYNDESIQHGQPTVTVLQYVTSNRFWYESFQNWQSEFLAVGTLLVLSIMLRERGSPESKAIGEPNAKTGSG